MWRSLEDRSILWWQAVASLNSQEFFAGWAVCRDLRFPWRQHHPNLSVPGCVSRGGDLRKGPFPSSPQLPDVPSSVFWGAILQKSAFDQQRSHAVDLQPGSQQQLRHYPEALLSPCGSWGPPGLPYQHVPQGHLVETAHFLPAIQLLPPVSQGRDGEAGSLGHNIFRVPTKVVCGWG